MPTGPHIRGRHMRSLLEQVKALPPPQRGRVLEALGPDGLRQIEESATTDWLPYQLDVRLTRALEEALGREAAARFFRQHQLASFQGPLFRPLIDSATTLFGLDPRSWARWIPRGWGIVFHECGQWVVDRSEAGAIDLALLAPPPEALEDEIWLRSLASGFSSILDLTRCEGTFALARVDRARSAVCYALRWSPRGG